MEDNKRNFKFNMLIGILTLILIATIIAQITILKCNMNNTQNVENYISQEVQDSIKNEIEEENIVSEDILNKEGQLPENELSINSEIVQNLYKYILDYNYYKELLVYRNEKVDLTNIDNQLILLTVIQNIDEEEAIQEKTYTDKFEHKHLFYSKETIGNKAKQIFGPDVKIKHEDTSPWDGTACLYRNDMYEYFDYEGGGGRPWQTSESNLIKAEQDENNIYIYDKYLHIVERDHIINYTNYAGYYDVYEASDRKIKLLDNINFEKEGFYDDKYDDVSKIDVIEEYLEKETPLYKHTFRKAEDESYYWYSTEPI